VKVEVVTIGTELILGYTLDSNGAELGRALAAAGVEIVRRTTIPDRPERSGPRCERLSAPVNTMAVSVQRGTTTKTVS
jgi:molybdopterin-biosynthesis enzyme MoeA-like protein